MRRLFLILLLPLFVLACGTTKTTLVTYSSTNYPLTMQMPEGWAISDNEDSITIASEEALLTTPSVANAARINISVTPSFFSGVANATEAIETAVKTFSNQEGAEVIQEIEAITINNQSAVQTVLRGLDTEGNEVILRYVILENFSVNQTAVVAAVHDADFDKEYGQLMADIVNSIQLGEGEELQ